MGIPIIQIDAFTEKPFSGNSAAIVFPDAPRDDDWMQLVAREMNLSETAYVEPRDDAWSLRWFTPAIEVDLCGHATLAAAHALWETERVPATDAVRFQTRSGILTAVREGGFIWLDFPSLPPEEIRDATERDTLLEGLGLAVETAAFIGRNRLDALVQLARPEDVTGFSPDFRKIVELPYRGIVLTAPAPGDSDFDFLSRFFAPAAGIDEDPVTGSAHCALGPFWSNLLGENALTGYQASPRGGTVKTRLEGDRVALGGKAVTVLRGTLV